MKGWTGPQSSPGVRVQGRLFRFPEFVARPVPLLRFVVLSRQSPHLPLLNSCLYIRRCVVSPIPGHAPLHLCPRTPIHTKSRPHVYAEQSEIFPRRRRAHAVIDIEALTRTRPV